MASSLMVVNSIHSHKRTIKIVIQYIVNETNVHMELDTANFFRCSMNTWRLTSSVRTGAPIPSYNRERKRYKERDREIQRQDRHWLKRERKSWLLTVHLRNFPANLICNIWFMTSHIITTNQLVRNVSVSEGMYQWTGFGVCLWSMFQLYFIAEVNGEPNKIARAWTSFVSWNMLIERFRSTFMHSTLNSDVTKLSCIMVALKIKGAAKHV